MLGTRRSALAPVTGGPVDCRPRRSDSGSEWGWATGLKDDPMEMSSALDQEGQWATASR